MLRRIFRSVAEFGVGELHLIHSYRVEKSFWQSPFLSQDKVETALIQGMERSGDTVMPRIFQHRRFKPFIQDQLADVTQGRQVLLAHPGKHATPNADSAQPRAVLIGPEGGFIDYEVALAQDMGATVVSLGDRILSVDTAICAVLARELG
jgi:RsmE family RNA methyltransferase